MASPCIQYIPRPDATPEIELSALASVYRIILDSRKENAVSVTSTNGDDAKGFQKCLAPQAVYKIGQQSL